MAGAVLLVPLFGVKFIVFHWEAVGGFREVLLDPLPLWVWPEWLLQRSPKGLLTPSLALGHQPHQSLRDGEGLGSCLTLSFHRAKTETQREGSQGRLKQRLV